MLDEIEQPFVSPLQIFKDQDKRAIFGKRFEKAAPRCERLVL